MDNDKDNHKTFFDPDITSSFENTVWYEKLNAERIQGNSENHGG